MTLNQKKNCVENWPFWKIEKENEYDHILRNEQQIKTNKFCQNSVKGQAVWAGVCVNIFVYSSSKSPIFSVFGMLHGHEQQSTGEEDTNSSLKNKLII